MDIPIPLTPPEKKVFSVGELTRRLKKAIEDQVRTVWVSGEISNYKGAGPSGHHYFTLKDAESQIPCAMWKGNAGRLRFEPENGQQVLAFGKVDLYIPYGKYQLIVDELEPRGTGALQLKFERLKEKLSREGLFDPARKRPLPPFPRKIVLVTSPTGAAVQDMTRTLRSRCPYVETFVYPVRVQGEGASLEIAAAVAQVNQLMPDVDVMIVGRGGGSIEDLWAFNEEPVARALFASKIPVISAVGHETDTTIADFVADVRALTPTDGAMKASPRLDDLLESLGKLDDRLRRGLKVKADLTRAQLDALSGGRALGRIEELPQQHAQRLDDLAGRLDVGALQAVHYLRERLDLHRNVLFGDLPQVPVAARQRLTDLSNLIHTHARRLFEAGRARLQQAAAQMEALSPVAILARGYSITRKADSGAILRNASEARPGDRLITRLGQGRIVSRVEKDPGENATA